MRRPRFGESLTRRGKKAGDGFHENLAEDPPGIASPGFPCEMMQSLIIVSTSFLSIAVVA
jgi:hypothetical protein